MIVAGRNRLRGRSDPSSPEALADAMLEAQTYLMIQAYLAPPK